MADLQLQRVRISAKALRSATTPRRSFLLVVGQALNELNVIQRCIQASSNSNGETNQPSHLREAYMTQNLFFLRLHMSKFHEIWEAFKNFQKDLLDVIEAVRRDEQIRASYGFLEDYFAKKKHGAGIVRNGYGFHFPTKQLPQMPLRQFEDSDSFDIFLHDSRANCLFSMCDFLLFRCMEKEIYGDIEDCNLQMHFDALFDGDAELHTHILHLFDAILSELLIRDFQIDLSAAELVEVADAATLSDLRLSYFIRVDQPLGE